MYLSFAPTEEYPSKGGFPIPLGMAIERRNHTLRRNAGGHKGPPLRNLNLRLPSSRQRTQYTHRLTQRFHCLNLKRLLPLLSITSTLSYMLLQRGYILSPVDT